MSPGSAAGTFRYYAECVDKVSGEIAPTPEGTLGLVRLVEAMHARIASVPGRPGPAQTSGITGLVYKSIRGVTRLVGGTVDGVLGLLQPMLQPPAADSPGAPQALQAPPARERGGAPR